ncbi:olfactory receptor 6C74-like [Pelodiscus sinensis]|uniref:olfactory receptor 6C74-like n=1 Tax=Pelodiscus sinensis TaxID=13735 RepID=UPI003F6A73BA
MQIRSMEQAEGRNHSLISEFILLGFGNDPKLQPLLFLLFLLIYNVTVAGNTLIIALVVVDHNLRTPMYYLLGNLSFLEICYTSAFLPRLLASLWTGDRSISVKGCFVQLYFFAVMSATEALLLAAMSYDRYVAICQPLRYAALMNGRVCGWLVAGSWLCSFLNCTLTDVFLWQLTFCDAKEMDHFFCDFTPLIKLSCSDTRTLELVTLTIAALGALAPCVLTLTSYVCIISTVLRIPSSTGRKKAFSTCSSHLIVLSVFYGAVITVYVVPTGNAPTVLHKILSVFYIVLTPLINPIIYCLRNKEVQESLQKALFKLAAFRNRHKL